MANPENFQLIPLIAIAVSMLTLILSFVKFGREVHVDDKREILRELDDCRRRCDAMHAEHQSVMAENRRLREENYNLYQRLIKLNGGVPPQ